MRTDVARDLSDSAFEFTRLWGQIGHEFGGGRIQMVESTTSRDLKRDLDTLAGIDAWQVVEGSGVMRGIASRIQWGHQDDPRYPYKTFTVRVERPNGAKTEREKRLYALEHPGEGWLYPHLTIQAYYTLPRREGICISAGVIETRLLYACVRDHPSGVRRAAGNGGEQFEVYSFGYLQQCGYYVKEFILRVREPEPIDMEIPF